MGIDVEILINCGLASTHAQILWLAKPDSCNNS